MLTDSVDVILLKYSSMYEITLTEIHYTILTDLSHHYAVIFC